ncbi:molecular chaperone [Clostridium estertheticum]|uniref:molecular chaperone n=1 Tax=Clostridium estertheticum TaxID=238834 RepID=UPI001C0E61D0|nr:molecular chaperone [Clostridium estertheticum]MBU3075499.1 molecular chaperone [Clostridium estertheticum]MBU3165671.1 molecular chaperone [Clostridium estertheticum]
MSTLSYKLHKDNSRGQFQNNKYKEKELRLMTTFQLREICYKEKLVKSIINPLDKDELIRLIMRYRGIEESLFIRKYDKDGMQRVQDFLKRAQKLILDEKNVQCPAKITIYDSLNTEVFDDYRVNCNSKLDESNMILVDNKFEVCTIFNLVAVREENEKKYYIVKDGEIPGMESKNKHYSLLYFEKAESELLYNIYYGIEELNPKHVKFYSMSILQFEIQKMKDTDIPLAIDFGTSSTTAGTYIDNEASFVKVIDVAKENLQVTFLIPSIVGIKAIEDHNIEYIFGYDAVKTSKISYIDDGLSIFYDIKRWVNDFEKMEKVIDIHGKWAFVKRKDIIKAYLEYVINLAKQQYKYNFKNIHISSPAKQKYKFYMLFKEILQDYVVENEDTLEEGAAVLFNTISELIESKKYVDGEKYKALIIDCGGGTTDLTSCNFTIYNNRVSYQIDIETAYENGDTDFGGNNLTFRIMQFIKILMARELMKDNGDIRNVILEEFDVDVFRFVDENGVLRIYEKLSQEYENVESIIPTKFKEYEDKSREDYYKVKSNYYFLFDLAERVKKEFFNNPSLLKVLLTSQQKHNIEGTVIGFDKWKLSYMNSGLLETVKEPPEIELNIYEVTVLLKADIYNIIKKFLRKLYDEDRLFDYSIIKLTGQSCKVEIFKEALKEFIPGKIIQFKRNKKDGKENYDLKLSCLRGSLKYLQAKKYGYANIMLSSKMPTLPYVISAFTHTGEEKILIHSVDRNRAKGTISRFMERIILKLYLKDTNDCTRYEYSYEVNPEDFERIVPEEVVKMYPDVITQQDTDNIVNDEVKFFVWAREEEWGFSVLSVLRKDEGLLMGKEAFFSFENDEWETNFFDGLK